VADRARSGRGRGRPPAADPRTVEHVALGLFQARGFDEVTVDQVAEAAGISRRTFFRYFGSKADVLFTGFDAEVARLARQLQSEPVGTPVFTAVRRAVLSTNTFAVEDVAELRIRIELLAEVPLLRAQAGLHYEAWQQAVARGVADRTGAAPGDLLPQVVARAAFGAANAGFQSWLEAGGGGLAAHLGAAFDALEAAVVA
jgi:mycofactocin system transcriptional regulator